MKTLKDDLFDKIYDLLSEKPGTSDEAIRRLKEFEAQLVGILKNASTCETCRGADVDELAMNLNLPRYQFVLEYNDGAGYHRRKPAVFIFGDKAVAAFEDEDKAIRTKRHPAHYAVTSWRITLTGPDNYDRVQTGGDWV